jgi:Ca2+-transporting ATPase
VVPFTPILILWANLIADIPPAIALGVDPEDDEIMDRPPKDPKKGIFSIASMLMLVLYGFSMATITLVVYAIAIYVEDYDAPDDPGSISLDSFYNIT